VIYKDFYDLFFSSSSFISLTVFSSANFKNNRDIRLCMDTSTSVKERVFLAAAIVLAVFILVSSSPATFSGIFDFDTITGATIGETTAHLFQTPLFWMMLIVILGIIFVLVSRAQRS